MAVDGRRRKTARPGAQAAAAGRPRARPAVGVTDSIDIDQSDLKSVKGIGAKVEARLKAAGITSLARLARTPVNELAAILDGLHGKFDEDRITREEWLSQAAALASAATGGVEAKPAKRVRHNFTAEIQLAIAGRDIVSSKIVHVQTGDEATWAGWDGQRIVAFIEDRAGAGPRVGNGPEEPTPVAESAPSNGLALHTFATVDASGPGLDVSGPAGALSGPLAATLSFDATAIGLPVGQLARATVDVFSRQSMLAKSLLVGSATADISPNDELVQVPCHVPTTGPLGNLFAVVRLFAVSEAGRKPSSILPNARLTASRLSGEHAEEPT
jgi:predicted flap endonuclease-1-like 5' DNA nuclease